MCQWKVLTSIVIVTLCVIHWPLGETVTMEGLSLEVRAMDIMPGLEAAAKKFYSVLSNV